MWHSIVAFLRSTLCTLFPFSSPHGCIVHFDGLNDLSFFDLGEKKKLTKEIGQAKKEVPKLERSIDLPCFLCWGPLLSLKGQRAFYWMTFFFTFKDDSSMQSNCILHMTNTTKK